MTRLAEHIFSIKHDYEFTERAYKQMVQKGSDAFDRSGRDSHVIAE